MATWILALLLMLAPPERYAPLHARFGVETVEQREERYLAIAMDVVEVLRDEPEPLQRRYAALLVAIAFLESGFAPDVDLGPCASLPVGRCDGGQAVSIWQIRIGAGTTADGWTKDDLQHDRQKAAKEALARIKRSLASCRRYGRDAGLRVYASGSCERGARASSARLALARRLIGR